MWKEKVHRNLQSLKTYPALALRAVVEVSFAVPNFDWMRCAVFIDWLGLLIVFRSGVKNMLEWGIIPNLSFNTCRYGLLLLILRSRPGAESSFR